MIKKISTIFVLLALGVVLALSGCSSEQQAPDTTSQDEIVVDTDTSASQSESDDSVVNEAVDDEFVSETEEEVELGELI